MSTIYEQHNKSFPLVSAYVITNAKGERVATIAFKFPKDGAGRLYAYVHWFGIEMVRGYANGYGYDKKSASLESAMSKLILLAADLGHGKDSPQHFIEALANIGGSNWDTKLRDAGFNVLQAV